MKRCPQCEFIYEDDQSLCDMDGKVLVFDSTPLPRLQAVTDPAGDFVPAANWRNHILPMIAAAVLGTVMFLVYYVSTHPLASRGIDFTPASSTTVPQSVPKEAAGPTTIPNAPSPVDSHSEKAAVPDNNKGNVKTDSTDEVKVGGDPTAGTGVPNVKPSDSPVTQPEKTDPASPKKPEDKAQDAGSVPRSQSSIPRRSPQRGKENSQKFDSKIASFFKKTGNVLKKPFNR
ncbi:MAG TPA: hypothetical protein VKB46_07055 [Pyrinomonadaceae bacterium]|nr:hypothetical protein [Pyrinomonadaceae bacterium]